MSNQFIQIIKKFHFDYDNFRGLNFAELISRKISLLVQSLKIPHCTKEKGPLAVVRKEGKGLPFLIPIFIYSCVRKLAKKFLR